MDLGVVLDVLGAQVSAVVPQSLVGDMKAEDYLIGLEWVLNSAKNENLNTSMPNNYICQGC